jgi:hypothetical protein
MKELSISMFLVLCLSSNFHSMSPSTTTNSVVPIEWWATVYPKNQEYIEIKVVVKEGFCVKPQLPFSVAYFNDGGVQLGTLKGEVVNKQKQMCQGTYISYFKLAYSAKSTGKGLMHWTLTGPRPFSGRVIQTGQ